MYVIGRLARVMHVATTTTTRDVNELSFSFHEETVNLGRGGKKKNLSDCLMNEMMDT